MRIEYAEQIDVPRCDFRNGHSSVCHFFNMRSKIVSKSDKFMPYQNHFSKYQKTFQASNNKIWNLKCVCLLSNVKFDAICHHQKFYHAPFFLSTYHYHIPKFAYAKLLTSNSQGQIVRRNLIFRIQNPPSFSLFRNLDLLSRLRPAHLRRKILISR